MATDLLKTIHTIDFDRLLKAARDKYAEYQTAIKPYRKHYVAEPENMGYPPEVDKIVRSAFHDYERWVKKNITELGLELKLSMLGDPIAITAVLAEV